jgi:hypothetical protein
MPPSDSSEIECPHCGESFYYELTRCPNCGRSVYPSDFDDAEEENGETEAWGVNPKNLGSSPSEPDLPSHPLTGIMIGWFTSGVIGVILFFILYRILSNASGESLISFLPLVSIPFGAGVGGYIAGVYNETHPSLSGVVVGLLSIGGAILLTAYQHDLATEPLIRPETLSWWGITVLAGWGGAALSHRTIQRQAVQQLFKPRTEYQLYTELLTKVQFDRGTAESLIAYEQKHTPSGVRLTWIQNAIDRWERDNRTSS